MSRWGREEWWFLFSFLLLLFRKILCFRKMFSLIPPLLASAQKRAISRATGEQKLNKTPTFFFSLVCKFLFSSSRSHNTKKKIPNFLGEFFSFFFRCAGTFFVFPRKFIFFSKFFQMISNFVFFLSNFWFLKRFDFVRREIFLLRMCESQRFANRLPASLVQSKNCCVQNNPILRPNVFHCQFFQKVSPKHNKNGQKIFPFSRHTNTHAKREIEIFVCYQKKKIFGGFRDEEIPKILAKYFLPALVVFFFAEAVSWILKFRDEEKTWRQHLSGTVVVDFNFFQKKKYSSCFKLLLNDRMFLWWRMRGFSTKQTRRTDEEGTQKARTLFFFKNCFKWNDPHTQKIRQPPDHHLDKFTKRTSFKWRSDIFPFTNKKKRKKKRNDHYSQ